MLTRPVHPVPQIQPDTDHEIVRSQLAEITATYSNATNDIGLVLAATVREDLTWLLNYCKDQYATHPPQPPNAQSY